MSAPEPNAREQQLAQIFASRCADRGFWFADTEEAYLAQLFAGHRAAVRNEREGGIHSRLQELVDSLGVVPTTPIAGLLTLLEERIPALLKRSELVEEAARAVLGDYAPCDQCGVPAAEWWHWSASTLGEEDDLTALCEACATSRGLLAECTPAEPSAHIKAIVKVRHLLVPVHGEAARG